VGIWVLSESVSAGYGAGSGAAAGGFGARAVG